MSITLHRAAPFAVFAAGMLGGIAVAATTMPAWWFCAGLLLMALLLATLARRDELALWLCIAFACAALGGLRWSLFDLALHANPSTPANGRNAVLEGLVTDEPDARVNDTRLLVRPARLVVESVDVVGDNPISNDVLVRVDKSVTWRYGDVVRAIGRMDAPPVLSEFDYREYLARQRVLSWMPAPERAQRLDEDQGSPAWAAMLRMKDAMRKSIQRILPNPESALLNGILIGDARELPPNITDAFRTTGTSHVVAISGFNVSLVINALMLFLARLFNKRTGALIALPIVIAYTLFVGANASVVRAAVMAGIALIGQALWRRGFSLNTLCAAATFMLLWNPNNLFDGGFQLSVMATLGLVLYADRIQGWVEPRVGKLIASERVRMVAMFFLEGLLITIAAQLTTLPLTLANFRALSLVALLTNVCVLPLQPMLMSFGFVAALVGLVHTGAGLVAALPGFALLTATLRVVEATARIPSASVPVYGFGGALVAGWYAALFAAWAYTGLVQGQRMMLKQFIEKRAVRFVLGVILLAGVGMGLGWWFTRSDGKLHVVLTGTGAFVQTPSGKQLVFASSNGALLSEAGRAMPQFDRQIEWLVMTRRDDRARGELLPIAQRYAVEQVLQPALIRGAIEEPTQMLADWRAATAATAVVTAAGGLVVALGDGVEAIVVNRANGEIGLRMTHGANTFEFIGESDTSPTPLPATDVVYVSPRSRNFASQAAALAPRYVIWADAGGLLPALNPSRTRALNLREARVVEFVSDGKALALVRP